MTIRATPVKLLVPSTSRAALAGGLTVLILFVLCWVGAAISNLNLPHMFVQLFDAPIPSVRALLEGGLWASVFGALAGLIGAASYNFVQARQPL